MTATDTGLHPLVEELADRGYSLVPVQANKKPYGRWKQYQKERAGLAQLTAWGREYDPPAWAVVTGEVSGVVVLDFDGETGLATLANLGLESHVRTGSGGAHVYVTHPGQPIRTVSQVSGSLAAAYPGMDVRGDGGYAVVAGRNENGLYELTSPLEAYPFDALPERLRGILLNLPGSATTAPTQAGLRRLSKDDGGRSLIRTALKEAGEIGRNVAGFNLACWLRDAGWAPEAAEGLLVEYASQVEEVNAKGEPEPYTVEEALASLESAYSRPPREAGGDGGDGGPAKSIATQLVDLAADAELYHDTDDTPYIRVPVNGHRETYAIKSEAFTRWLRRSWYLAHGGAVAVEALNNARETLAAKAMFEGERRAVHVRIGGDTDAVYVDLGDPEWRVVRVTAQGWDIVDDSPVLFRRPGGSQPLPEPVRGGRLDQLREFVNVDDDQWPLMAAYLVGALKPSGPYPVLVLTGTQGSAKSTTAALIRALIDPAKAPLRGAARDERDLMIAATNSWMSAFDNLSSLSVSMSDALCRLSTGGGFATRQLYTDGEEVIFEAQRPTLLTAIGEVVTRPDLLDRSILLALPQLPDTARRTEDELWEAFEAARPALLGALLDAVSGAMANVATVEIQGMPRLADFTRWAVAAEARMELPEGAILAAYRSNRDEAKAVALEASPITTALERLLTKQPTKQWSGTTNALLTELSDIADTDVRRGRRWPASASRLGTELRTIEPNLGRLGIKIAWERTAQRRVVHLEWVEPGEAA